MALFGLLGFLFVPIGAIALLVLIVRKVPRGARPPSVNPPPAPVEPSVSDALLVFLVALGAMAYIFIYVIGGALGIR